MTTTSKPDLDALLVEIEHASSSFQSLIDLRQREGREDRERLEFYFEAIRELNLRLLYQNKRWGWEQFVEGRSTPPGNWYGWFESPRKAIDTARASRHPETKREGGS